MQNRIAATKSILGKTIASYRRRWLRDRFVETSVIFV
jgi:hypothetical protein